MSEIPVVCATDYDVILPADVVKEIQAVDVSVCTLGSVTEVVTATQEEDDQDESPESSGKATGADSALQGNVDNPDTRQAEFEGDVAVLVSEQKADPTLDRCWAQAAEDKGGFVVHRGLLYHKNHVEGQPVSQLCVPQGRRDNVLRLAHESVFDGKLCNKWPLPFTVVKVMSQNSYLVDLGDNGTRHVHANKIRHVVAMSTVVLL